MAVAVTLGGCASSSRKSDLPPAPPRFFLELTSGPDRRARTVELPQSGTQITVDSIPVLVESDFRGVDVMRVELGLCLRFSLDRISARSLYQISLQHRGSRLVLVLDGAPVGVRVIDSIIDDGQLFTFLEVPDADLTELAARVQAAIEKANR